MATKDELLAFAELHGIGVDSSMLKADIESAIADAGYDPTTLEAGDMSEPDTTATDPIEDWADTLTNSSSDSTFSTYTEVAPDPDIRPAPGRQIEETRGEAAES